MTNLTTGEVLEIINVLKFHSDKGYVDIRVPITHSIIILQNLSTKEVQSVKDISVMAQVFNFDDENKTACIIEAIGNGAMEYATATKTPIELAALGGYAEAASPTMEGNVLDFPKGTA